MKYFLSDARSFLQPYVDGGTTDNDKIDSRINEATQHLITVANWKLLLQRIRINVPNTRKHITLPQCIDYILRVNPDNIPSNVFSQYYEFLEGGPGRIDNMANTPCKDLVDMGSGFVTYSDPPLYDIDGNEFASPLKLIALSTSASDTTKTINLRGKGAYNNRHIDGNGDLGEEMPILRWVDGVEGQLPATLSTQDQSEFGYKYIDHLSKPTTNGHVTIYAYNPDYTTGADGEPMLHYIGKYHSWETQPSLRRYKIMHHTCHTHLTCLAKLAYQPVRDPQDTLLIQSLPALKAMIQALNFYDDQNQNDGQAYEAQALRVLQNQLRDYSPDTNEITVEDSFALGEVKGIV